MLRFGVKEKKRTVLIFTHIFPPQMYHSDHGVDFPDLSFQIPGSPAERGAASAV